MNHSFTLVLEGPDPVAPANLDRLFEAGCDDATFGERDGLYIADFDREAPSFSEALTSAIAAIEAAAPGLRVIRVEPEDLVTAAEIAARTKRSRESIRQLFEGARGEGGFPRPIAWLSDRTRLWHWSEVSDWFAMHFRESVPRGEDAELLGAANALLTLRRFLARAVAEEAIPPNGKEDFSKAWSHLGSWLTESSQNQPATAGSQFAPLLAFFEQPGLLRGSENQKSARPKRRSISSTKPSSD